MNDNELKRILFELEERNDKNKAFFGFYQYGGAPDESCIKANRKGLELFAIELLKAGIDSRNRSYEKNKTEAVNLNIDWTDQNADFFFDYVELTNKDKESEGDVFPDYEDTWKDKVFKTGCIISLVVLIFLIILGIRTVVSWI